MMPSARLPSASARARWPYWPVLLWAAWIGALAVALLLTRPLAQEPAYHQFADARPWLGIPHFGDVASNAPLALAGLAGLWTVLRRAGQTAGSAGPEGLPVAVLFFGAVALTGLGSAYYHWAPDTARLVWDRLPLGLVAAAFPLLALVERAPITAAGLRAARLWLALGPLSAGYWHYTEGLGRGDLRPYLLVQGMALLGAATLVLLLPRRHTAGAVYAGAGLLYGAAVACEQADRLLLAATGLLSGHTLKHLLAAAAVSLLAWGWARQAAPAASPR